MTKILITGSNGLVGSALRAELESAGYSDLCLARRGDCDLTRFDEVKEFFLKERPEIVFHNAAAVYGIGGNLKNKGSIFLDNILMNTHVIEASRLAGVKKIVAMGTVAAYPTPKTVPVKEEQIWEGPPHGSENSYGFAKRAMLAQLLAYQENYGLDFAYVVSTNLYGPHDRFDVEQGHVIPSLIRKFCDAKKEGSSVTIWGDGSAARDFLYSKDMAKALVLIMQKQTGMINVASGRKTLIKEVVAHLTDYFDMQGKVLWNAKMPNGRDFYEVDLTKIKALGFQPRYSIEEALTETLDWFTENYEQQLVRC